MAFIGPINPGTISDDAAVGTIAWSNPDNAKTQNNTYADVILTPLASSHYLKATNFGFTIPDGAIIDGVLVEIDRFATNVAVKDKVASLVVAGAVAGGNRKAFPGWAVVDTDTYRIYGGILDVWGCALTPANVNAADFGVVLQVENTSAANTHTAYVDHIRITVYYSFPIITGTLIKTIDVSATESYPQGLAFDGKYLWFGSYTHKDIFQMDRLGNIIKSVGIAAMGLTPFGICFDGKYLWWTSGSIIYQMDRLGHIIKTLNVGAIDTQVKGITTDGKSLWFVGDTHNCIYKIDKSGNLLQTIDVGTTSVTPRGLAFDGKYLWWASRFNPELHKIDTSGNIIFEIDISLIETTPTGLTFDGKYLWLCGEHGNIYQLQRY